MIADEDAVDHIPKIPHNVIEVMVVLMVLLLALKLVQSGVPHTCGGGHDMTQCATAPPPPPFLISAGGGLNLLIYF